MHFWFVANGFKIWSSGDVTWIGSKVGHEVVVNLLTGWNLETFRAEPVKKPPCRYKIYWARKEIRQTFEIWYSLSPPLKKASVCWLVLAHFISKHPSEHTVETVAENNHMLHVNHYWILAKIHLANCKLQYCSTEHDFWWPIWVVASALSLIKVLWSHKCTVDKKS